MAEDTRVQAAAFRTIIKGFRSTSTIPGAPLVDVNIVRDLQTLDTLVGTIITNDTIVSTIPTLSALDNDTRVEKTDAETAKLKSVAALTSVAETYGIEVLRTDTDHYNNCLINAFLIAVSPTFRTLNFLRRFVVATIVRDLLLYKIVQDRDADKIALYVDQINSDQELTDDLFGVLCDYFKIQGIIFSNIPNQAVTPIPVSLLAGAAGVNYTKQVIGLYNNIDDANNGHYSAVKFKDDKYMLEPAEANTIYDAVTGSASGGGVDAALVSSSSPPPPGPEPESAPVEPAESSTDLTHEQTLDALSASLLLTASALALVSVPPTTYVGAAKSALGNFFGKAGRMLGLTKATPGSVIGAPCAPVIPPTPREIPANGPRNTTFNGTPDEAFLKLLMARRPAITDTKTKEPKEPREPREPRAGDRIYTYIVWDGKLLIKNPGKVDPLNTLFFDIPGASPQAYDSHKTPAFNTVKDIIVDASFTQENLQLFNEEEKEGGTRNMSYYVSFKNKPTMKGAVPVAVPGAAARPATPAAVVNPFAAAGAAGARPGAPAAAGAAARPATPAPGTTTLITPINPLVVPGTAVQTQASFDFTKLGLSAEPSGDPKYFWVPISILRSWLVDDTHKAYRDYTFAEHVRLLAQKLGITSMVNEVYLRPQPSWASLLGIKKPSEACQQSSLVTSDCAAVTVYKDAIEVDEFSKTGRLSKRASEDPAFVKYNELVAAIGAEQDPAKKAALAKQLDSNPDYKNHTVEIRNPATGVIQSYDVPNPYRAVHYRERMASFANPAEKSDASLDVGGAMRSRNATLLNHFVEKEIVADKGMAIAILESLWFCGENKLLDTENCFPLRFLGEFREYAAMKVQKSQRDEALKVLNTSSWPMLDQMVGKLLGFSVGSKPAPLDPTIAAGAVKQPVAPVVNNPPPRQVITRVEPRADPRSDPRGAATLIIPRALGALNMKPILPGRQLGGGIPAFTSRFRTGATRV